MRALVIIYFDDTYGNSWWLLESDVKSLALTREVILATLDIVKLHKYIFRVFRLVSPTQSITDITATNTR